MKSRIYNGLKLSAGLAAVFMVMGCQTTSINNNTKSVTGSDTNTVKKVIVNKDETNPLPATASSPLLLYYFAPTLLM